MRLKSFQWRLVGIREGTSASQRSGYKKRIVVCNVGDAAFELIPQKLKMEEEKLTSL